MRRWYLWLPLIIFAFCGIVFVPNVLVAMDRSDQKRSMADIRTIATALEEYASANPDAALTLSVPPGPVARLTTLLGKEVPTTDHWGNPYRISIAPKFEYTIWSTGKDGARDAKWENPGYTTDFRRDIVFSNGTFTQYPEGV